MSIRERWLPICLAGAFVCLMALASQLTGCDEILFPETAAILCGAWVQPHQAWNVDRPRMMLLMGSGAIMGLCLNLLVPGPIWARAVLGYACCALAMNGLGADMTPMVSAVILPVLLGTRDWAYPVTVIVLVGVICLGQMALERWGLRERIDFKPLRPPRPAGAARLGSATGGVRPAERPSLFQRQPPPCGTAPAGDVHRVHPPRHDAAAQAPSRLGHPRPGRSLRWRRPLRRREPRGASDAGRRPVLPAAHSNLVHVRDLASPRGRSAPPGPPRPVRRSPRLSRERRRRRGRLGHRSDGVPRNQAQGHRKGAASRARAFLLECLMTVSGRGETPHRR